MFCVLSLRSWTFYLFTFKLLFTVIISQIFFEGIVKFFV